MGDDGWKVHDAKEQDNGHGEPPGGWVTSTEKYTSEIQAISLCRFTGDKLGLGGPCAIRIAGRHPDVNCTTMFVSAKAFEEKTLDLTPILSYERGEIDGAELPHEIRAVEGGEASGVVSAS